MLPYRVPIDYLPYRKPVKHPMHVLELAENVLICNISKAGGERGCKRWPRLSCY